VVSLEDVYRFDPLPPTMDAQQAKHLLGVQGNVWTEHIRTAERVSWMAFPRAAAIAEMGWSAPKARSWEDFLFRLPGLYATYDALAIPHADSPYAVLDQRDYTSEKGKALVTLSTQTGVAGIRYTLDGSEPTSDSPKYRETLSLPLAGNANLAAASFVGTQRMSRTMRVSPGRYPWHSAGELKLCSENIALGLEDDGLLQDGRSRAVFPIDIQNPCWIWPGADLHEGTSIQAMVGSVPFNFQIGDLVNKISFASPQTEAGELLVLLDNCQGEELARLPLAPAAANSGVTMLPIETLKRAEGRHDLCFRFAQPALQPMWALSFVELQDSQR